MKVDAEFLNKNRFWVLLGVAVPFTLVALIVLSTSVAGTIAAARQKVEEDLKKVKNQPEVKSQEWVNQAQKKANIYKKEEDKVWAAAWNEQQDIFTWPNTFEARYHYKDGLFARSIDAKRSGAADMTEAAPLEDMGEAPSADAVAPGAPKTYTGTIQNVSLDYVNVIGKKDKQTFLRTANIDVKLDGSKKFFNELRPGDKVTVIYEAGKYFGDELSDTELPYYRKHYAEQIPPILEQVQPVDEKGKGVVQFPNWIYKKGKTPPAGSPYFNFVAGPWRETSLKEGSREAWTAQEDIWIQRELYRLVRLANDYVADLEGKGGPGKGKTFTFQNPYWQITATLTPSNQLEVELTNRLSYRQRTEVEFLVKVGQKTAPVSVKFEKQPPLNSGQKSKKMSFPVPSTALPDGIYGVSQVLNWETAAVKRIDRICIGKGVNPSGTQPGAGAGVGPGSGIMPPGAVGPGSDAVSGSAAGMGMAHSHRTLPKGLTPFFKTEAEAGADGQASGDMGAPPMDPMGQGFAPPGPGGPGGPLGPGGAAAAVKLSPNGFAYDRYVELTPQARRVPVGVVLIVDQTHVGRVMAAFGNSRMRFLTTQVLLNRYPNSLRPEQGQMFAKGYGGPGGPPMPGLTPFGGPGGLPMIPAPGMFAPGMGGSMGDDPYNPYGMGRNALTSDEERQSNLELVLYGIVSLYERYPPRPGQAATPE